MSDSRAPRLAILADYLEESWPSMARMAGRLHAALADGRRGVAADLRRPPFVRRAARLGVARGLGHNADRLLNRLVDYPRWLRRQVRRGEADLWHVADHSYGQLLHELPPQRSGVFVHDLDTFRCLIDPAAAPRPRWFRAMMRRVLAGVQRAAVVFHLSEAVRREIERHGLLDASRLVHAPPGTSIAAPADAAPPPLDGPYLLHVGSCVARKRIDVLLEAFARAASGRADLRLAQIGGAWTAPQRTQIERLGIASRLRQARGVGDEELARWYAGASAVLLTSDAEGFGLPVVEALACGAPVVASDIEALREAGGDAATYRPAGDVEAWAATIDALLDGRLALPPPQRRRARAALFTWERHADAVAGAYRRIWSGARVRAEAPSADNQPG